MGGLVAAKSVTRPTTTITEGEETHMKRRKQQFCDAVKSYATKHLISFTYLCSNTFTHLKVVGVGGVGGGGRCGVGF